jgi:hypothetical protein
MQSKSNKTQAEMNKTQAEMNKTQAEINKTQVHCGGDTESDEPLTPILTAFMSECLECRRALPPKATHDMQARMIELLKRVRAHERDYEIAENQVRRNYERAWLHSDWIMAARMSIMAEDSQVASDSEGALAVVTMSADAARGMMPSVQKWFQATMIATHQEIRRVEDISEAIIGITSDATEIYSSLLYAAKRSRNADSGERESLAVLIPPDLIQDYEAILGYGRRAVMKLIGLRKLAELLPKRD